MEELHSMNHLHAYQKKKKTDLLPGELPSEIVSPPLSEKTRAIICSKLLTTFTEINSDKPRSSSLLFKHKVSCNLVSTHLS